MSDPHSEKPSDDPHTGPETSGADWWLLVMVGLAVVAASSLIVVGAVLWLR